MLWRCVSEQPGDGLPSMGLVGVPHHFDHGVISAQGASMDEVVGEEPLSSARSLAGSIRRQGVVQAAHA